MREINRILCPVDLSDVSRHAIDHAVLLARWYKARITALHVCNPLVIPMADFTVVGTVPPPLLTEDEVKEVHARVLACFAAAPPIDVDVFVEDGHPAKQILARARTLAANLIVIGTHGTGGFQHLVLGSVTERVLRQARCPVLTVPPHARTTSKLPFKRILCPVDFSDSSLAALDFAFSIAQEGDAEVTIMHACEWPDADEPPTHEFRLEREGDVAAKLRALVPDSIREWCYPRTRLVHGKAYREILRVATEDSSDLIVMGVHGRNALDLMLFGSTTNQVVRRATCPVLTLRK
jgi:nucleotide-binding universal stress UspA family protein